MIVTEDRVAAGPTVDGSRQATGVGEGERITEVAARQIFDVRECAADLGGQSTAVDGVDHKHVAAAVVTDDRVHRCSDTAVDVARQSTAVRERERVGSRSAGEVLDAREAHTKSRRGATVAHIDRGDVRPVRERQRIAAPHAVDRTGQCAGRQREAVGRRTANQIFDIGEAASPRCRTTVGCRDHHRVRDVVQGQRVDVAGSVEHTA